ncbi:hypothetical protein PO909_001457 [Leuciscus waleckii]
MPGGGATPQWMALCRLRRLVDGDSFSGFVHPHSLLLPIMADSSRLLPQATGDSSSASSQTAAAPPQPIAFLLPPGFRHQCSKVKGSGEKVAGTGKRST